MKLKERSTRRVGLWASWTSARAANSSARRDSDTATTYEGKHYGFFHHMTVFITVFIKEYYRYYGGKSKRHDNIEG